MSAGMRDQLLAMLSATFLAACVSPLGETAGTPLTSVESNYVILWSGIPGLLGITASAIIVGDGLAVTNRHVAESTSQLAGYVGGRGMIGVEVVALSDRMDLALLEIPHGLGKPMAVASPTIGGTVWLMGSPAITDLGQPAVASGTVLRADAWACTGGADATDRRAPSPQCGDRRVDMGILVTAQAAPGYSGGPLIDQSGRLVGLTQGIFSALFDEGGNPTNLDGPAVFAYRMDEVMTEVRRLQNIQHPPRQTAAGPHWLVAVD